jgi:hypothetical protein
MSDHDLIRRGDALSVLRDEIDLARIAMPQCVPILAADMRAIAAIPAVDPLTDPRVQALVEALADVYRLHMRRGPAWDHEPTKEVMDRAAAALAAFKGGEA